MSNFIEINESKHGLITINKSYIVKLEEDHIKGGTFLYIDVTANPIFGSNYYYHVTESYNIVKNWFQ